MHSSENSSGRKIRSFVRRQGRITQAQLMALDNLWDQFVLNPNKDCDFSQIFGRTAPLIMEIGFGNGECLATMAAANPDQNYIGIEVHRPGVGHLLWLLNQQQITNVRIYCHDAMEIMEHRIKDHSLSGVHLFFPDPWPKKKHHKRRIVQTSFAEWLVKKLQPQGYFHAATDWQHYAESMLQVLMNAKDLTNMNSDGGYIQRPKQRPMTKFELRGMRLGHEVWDLMFKRD